MIQPSPEARLLAQEELTALLHAQIKQLSLDMQRSDQRLFEHVQKGFDQANALIKETATKEELAAVETRVNERFDKVEGKLDEVLSLLKKGGSKEV